MNIKGINKEILELEIFKNKKLSDIYEKVYNNYIDRQKKINDMLSFVEENIKDKSDLAIILPNYKELWDSEIENERVVLEMLKNLKDLIKAILSNKELNETNSIFEELKNLDFNDLSQLEETVDKKIESLEKKIIKELPPETNTQIENSLKNTKLDNDIDDFMQEYE